MHCLHLKFKQNLECSTDHLNEAWYRNILLLRSPSNIVFLYLYIFFQTINWTTGKKNYSQTFLPKYELNYIQYTYNGHMRRTMYQFTFYLAIWSFLSQCIILKIQHFYLYCSSPLMNEIKYAQRWTLTALNTNILSQVI